MKAQDWEKVQNDDYKLQNLIQDKYERKKFTEAKSKDPMSLIIAGKEPKRKVKEEDEFFEVNSSG